MLLNGDKGMKFLLRFKYSFFVLNFGFYYKTKTVGDKIISLMSFGLNFLSFFIYGKVYYGILKVGPSLCRYHLRTKIKFKNFYKKSRCAEITYQKKNLELFFFIWNVFFIIIL